MPLEGRGLQLSETPVAGSERLYLWSDILELWKRNDSLLSRSIDDVSITYSRRPPIVPVLE